MAEEKNHLVAQIRRWNTSSLRRFLHNKRSLLSRSFRENGSLRISDWHAVSELQILVQQEPLTQTTMIDGEHEREYETLLQRTSDWAARQRLAEDLRTGRYKMLRRQDSSLDDDVFALKYFLAIRESDQAFGYTSDVDQGLQRPTEYEHIETAATPTVADDVIDLGEVFETLWPLTLRLRYLLRSHSRTTQLYRYQP